MQHLPLEQSTQKFNYEILWRSYFSFSKSGDDNIPYSRSGISERILKRLLVWKYKEIIHQLQSLIRKAASTRVKQFPLFWIESHSNFCFGYLLEAMKKLYFFPKRVKKLIPSFWEFGFWCEISLCKTYFSQRHLLSSSLSCESCKRGNTKKLPSWSNIPLWSEQLALKSWSTVLFTKLTKIHGYIKLMNLDFRIDLLKTNRRTDEVVCLLVGIKPTL